MLIFVCMQCLFLLFGSVWRKPKNEHFGFTAAVFDSHTHLNASMFYQWIKLKEKVLSIRWSIEMLNVFVMNLYVVCGVCVCVCSILHLAHWWNENVCFHSHFEKSWFVQTGVFFLMMLLYIQALVHCEFVWIEFTRSHHTT